MPTGGCPSASRHSPRVCHGGAGASPLPGDPREAVQRLEQRTFQLARCLLKVAVRPAERLGDDPIDHPHLEKLPGSEAQGAGGLGGLAGALPKDRGAPLRRDDRVVGVLEHHNLVAHPDAERAAAPPLPDDDHDDRRLQRRHRAQVPRDRLRLSPLLRADPRVGAGGVDERDEREAELLRELEHTVRLPVPLRVGAPEIAQQILLRVSPLLVSDHHGGAAAEPGEAGDEGAVVAEEPVPGEFDETVRHQAEVVERVGTMRVPRDLDALPGVQVPVDFPAHRVELGLEARDLIRHVDRLRLGELLEPLDPGLEFDDRLLEVEASIHGVLSIFRWSRRYSTILTGVPTGTIAYSSSTSSFSIRTQPALACFPIVSGSQVPWMP